MVVWVKEKHEKENKTEHEAEEAQAAKVASKDDRQELIGTLQRLQAEFENYKKRTERENADYALQANASLIRQLLPIIDNLELALQHAGEAERKEPLYKGVELVSAQLLDVLEAAGAKPLAPVAGDRFDPRLHEAMLTEQREGAERNSVLETLQKGYTLGERVLRTAKVKVAK